MITENEKLYKLETMLLEKGLRGTCPETSAHFPEKDTFPPSIGNVTFVR